MCHYVFVMGFICLLPITSTYSVKHQTHKVVRYCNKVERPWNSGGAYCLISLSPPMYIFMYMHVSSSLIHLIVLCYHVYLCILCLSRFLVILSLLSPTYLRGAPTWIGLSTSSVSKYKIMFIVNLTYFKLKINVNPFDFC